MLFFYYFCRAKKLPMKKIVLLLLTILLNVAFTIPAKPLQQTHNPTNEIDDPPSGKALVLKNACTLCHHPEKRIVGPSFNTIAVKYQGNSTKIFEFLEGKSNPIVEPEAYQYMEPVIKHLDKLTKREKEAIAKYISRFTISN